MCSLLFLFVFFSVLFHFESKGKPLKYAEQRKEDCKRLTLLYLLCLWISVGFTTFYTAAAGSRPPIVMEK